MFFKVLQISDEIVSLIEANDHYARSGNHHLQILLRRELASIATGDCVLHRLVAEKNNSVRAFVVDRSSSLLLLVSLINFSESKNKKARKVRSKALDKLLQMDISEEQLRGLSYSLNSRIISLVIAKTQDISLLVDIWKKADFLGYDYLFHEIIKRLKQLEDYFSIKDVDLLLEEISHPIMDNFIIGVYPNVVHPKIG